MIRKPLVWTARALADLGDIAVYIATEDFDAAERWTEGLIAVSVRAGQMPMSGRVVPELGRDDIREVIRRRYRIIYRIHDDRIEVLTVFEGHRRLPADLLESSSEGDDFDA